MTRLALCTALCATLATSATAEPLTAREAARQLFSPRGVSVELVRQPGLSDQDMAIVQEVAKQQQYHAAVAYAPGDGLVANATVAAVQYHRVAAAEQAALAACSARREDTSQPCAIVARIRPAKYAPRALEMSLAATEGFRATYRRARGARAFAISPSSRGWAVAKGADAAANAVAACNAQEATEGADDCLTVIFDN